MARIASLIMAMAALAACSQPAEAPQAEAETAELASAEAVAASVQDYARRFEAAAPVASADRATAYQFQFEGLSTATVPMTAFEGEVVLVVNTASKCGFTPQYEGLQDIYEEYHSRGFEVVGVPANNFNGQEPGSAEEIQEFCTLNYGVTFPMAAKTEVVGDARHPFYAWAEQQIGESAVPQWNFHKILIGRDGRIIRAFGTRVEPTSEEVRNAITTALAAQTTTTPASSSLR